VKISATLVAIPISDLASKTHPPKPCDIVQGIECIIDMMEETLQICERAQRSMQTASHHNTFPFGLRPSSDVYTRQAAKSSQIQYGRQESSNDLRTELRARCDLHGILCTYHKGARCTLRGCRLRRKIDQEHTSPRIARAPTSLDGSEFQKVRIRVSHNDQGSILRRVLVVLENEPQRRGATDFEEARRTQGNANCAQ
jgi:hypothetical protein